MIRRREPKRRIRTVTIWALATMACSFLTPLTATAADVRPVVLIVMENHSFGPNDPGVGGLARKYIVGSPDAPYINNTLIPSATLFTNYDAVEIDSLPNYLDMLAGTYGSCSDDSCPVDSDSTDNVLRLMGVAGVSFDSYAESMPSNCKLAFSGHYNIHHNPEIYLTDVDRNSGLPYRCDITDVPFPSSWPDPLPQFSLVIPDVCHDMHGNSSDCPHATDQIVKDGDTWLSQNVPVLLSRGAIVIVTFDEGTGLDATGGGGHVATIMAGPEVAAGAADESAYTHFSLLAGLEHHFGLSPLLGASASATPLPIPGGASPPPAPTISGFSPQSGATGTQVTINGTGFTEATAVRFNGSTAQYTVTDDSTMQTSVPQGAITGPISVTTTGGTATSSSDFSVTGPPPPALVQHARAKGANRTVPTATWPQTTDGGDLLVASLGWTGSGSPVPPSGWTRAANVGGTALYYLPNAPSQSGAVSFSGSNLGGWVLDLMEWSGMAAAGTLDRTATHTTASVTSTIADSGTTSPTFQPSEVALGAVRALASVTQSNLTNGFTVVDAGI